MHHPSGSTWCECTACGECFAGLSLFDQHRVGEHGHGRCCRSPQEMTGKGWTKNRHGRWRRAPREGESDTTLAWRRTSGSTQTGQLDTGVRDTAPSPRNEDM